MIEPTETETKQTLETFAAAMLAIIEESRVDGGEVVKTAPHRTARSRPNEAQAARKPKLISSYCLCARSRLT